MLLDFVEQFRGQVLLKGLVTLLGLALKGSMDVLGQVANQVEKADGQAALTSPLGVALEAAGFRPTPRHVPAQRSANSWGRVSDCCGFLAGRS